MLHTYALEVMWFRSALRAVVSYQTIVMCCEMLMNCRHATLQLLMIYNLHHQRLRQEHCGSCELHNRHEIIGAGGRLGVEPRDYWLFASRGTGCSSGPRSLRPHHCAIDHGPALA